MNLVKRKVTFFIIVGIVILAILVSFLFIFTPYGISVTELKEPFDNEDIFNDFGDKLQVSIGDICYTISYDEDIKEIKNQLSKVRVSKKTVYQNDEQLPNITNYIRLNGYNIGFSQDFKVFSVHRMISSEYPQRFKVINKNAVKKLCELVANSESTRINTALKITDIKTGSNLNGVTVSVECFELEGFSPNAVFKLNNNSGEKHSFGMKKSLYYLEGSEKILCRTFKNSKDRHWSVNAVARVMWADENANEEYSFYLDDVTKEGTYRLETDALWCEFTLVKADK